MNTPPITNSDCNAAHKPQLADYSITRILQMTREQWRAQLLHDIANAFEEAFDALEVR